MERKIKSFLLLSLMLVTLLGSSMGVMAKEPDDNLKVIAEFEMENGAHVTLYEILHDEFEITPRRFPVYHEMRMDVEFEGWIVPQETMSFNGYVEEYGINMSGVLYLQDYQYDIWYIPPTHITRATYIGTVHGSL